MLTSKWNTLYYDGNHPQSIGIVGILMRSRRYEAALASFRECVNTAVSPAKKSLFLVRGNLVWNRHQRDLTGARVNIKTLIKIQIQLIAFSKITDDLGRVGDNITEIGSRSIAIDACLMRLREVARLSPNKVISAAISQFPTTRNCTVRLRSDYAVLFSGMDPTTVEIASFLPALAQDTGVPVDFLEAASGAHATYDLRGDRAVMPVSDGEE
jgi:hypothetical protein